MMEEIHYKPVIAICQDSNVATYTQLKAHSIDFYSAHVINKENFTHKKNIEIIKVESIQAMWSEVKWSEVKSLFIEGSSK